MNIGDLVKYKRQYDQRTMNTKAIGIIVGQSSSGSKFLVEWNNGTRQWRYTHIMEVICK